VRTSRSVARTGTGGSRKLESIAIRVNQRSPAIPQVSAVAVVVPDRLSTNAHSVVELSLSSFFHREYSSVYDAIVSFFQPSEPEKAEEEWRAWEQRYQTTDSTLDL